MIQLIGSIIWAILMFLTNIYAFLVLLFIAFIFGVFFIPGFAEHPGIFALGFCGLMIGSFIYGMVKALRKKD